MALQIAGLTLSVLHGVETGTAVAYTYDKIYVICRQRKLIPHRIRTVEVVSIQS